MIIEYIKTNIDNIQIIGDMKDMHDVIKTARSMEDEYTCRFVNQETR